MGKCCSKEAPEREEEGNIYQAPLDRIANHGLINTENAAMAASAVVEGIAGTLTGVVAQTPIAPILEGLQKAKKAIDDVKEGQEELSRVHRQCTLITTLVLNRCISKDAMTTTLPVAPLQDCVENVLHYAKVNNGRGTLSKMGNMRQKIGTIRELKREVDKLIPILGLAATIQLAEKMDVFISALEEAQDKHFRVHQQSRTIKLASVPNDKPADKAWHVNRNKILESLYNYLSTGPGPQIVGLAGRSGSGKTTCAASLVGEPTGVIQEAPGETREQAFERLNRGRVYFSDGIVWLKVGPESHVPGLMRQLARRFHNDIEEREGYPPGSLPIEKKDGWAFIHEKVVKKSLRCLVVADDVWELEVLEELRKTGMSVLFTCRDHRLVERAGAELVVVDKMTDLEAKGVLIAATELKTGVRLPQAALDTMDICDHLANHLAFVGRWSAVKGSEEEDGWKNAVASITAEMEVMKVEGEKVNSTNGESTRESSDPVEDRRVAIFRVGFRHLEAQERELYLALAVMPNGYAFAVKEAAILLADEWKTDYALKRAARALSVLEQWAVLRMEAGLFRMHDAHAEFARKKLRATEEVRGPTVQRWRQNISRLDAVRFVDHYVLGDLWRGIEDAGGEGWRVSLPYKIHLATLDDSDPDCAPSLKAVVDFCFVRSEYGLSEDVARRLVAVLQASGAPDHEVKNAVVSLYHTCSGSPKREVSRWLGGMVDTSWWTEDMDVGRHNAKQIAGDLRRDGYYLIHAKILDKGYDAYAKALAIQDEYPTLFSNSEVETTLTWLAIVLSDLGRHDEAIDTYQRCLTVVEEMVGPRHKSLSVNLHNMAVCMLKVGRTAEAEYSLRRSLSISEDVVGPNDPALLRGIRWLATCVEKIEGGDKEAAILRQRARKIREANPGSLE